MSKKRIAISVVALLLVGMVIFTVVKYVRTSKLTTAFSSDEWHFSFKYDAQKWQPASESEQKLKYADVNFAFIMPKSTSTSLTIKTSKKAGKTELDLNASIADLDAKLPLRLKEFNKIDSKIVKLAGVDAIDYRFRYAYQPVELLPKEVGMQRELIFFKNETLYTLMLSTAPGEFDKDNQEFEQILKTFKVN